MRTDGDNPDRALIFDPFAGISGDMILGALVDLGLAAEWLHDFVATLGLSAGAEVERADRSGISCGRVRFDVPDERAHRHLPDLLEIVDGSGAPGWVRERAATVFQLLAEAEGSVHGIAPEKVHFHEVGALDSILDVMCGLGGIHELGFQRFFTRPVGVGTGTVAMAHGTFPLPAPATAHLLAGFTVRETGYGEECTTPTGAAMLAALTGGVAPPSEVVYERSGYGAGSRDPAGRPNCLRLIRCRLAARADSMYLVQADIDDQAPEYVAASREMLMSAGAVDVLLTRVDMKKGRPGVRLEALTPTGSLGTVLDAMFVGTRTIGVRYWEVDRVVLPREEEVLDWRGQRIRRKRVLLPDGRTRVKPEYDDVVAAARALGLAPHDVRTELDGGTLD